MNKLKVFICDDSASVRERLVILALDLPEVDVVGQAEDAPGSLDAISQTRPDVVILDIRMPGGSGIEVLRRLKELTPAPAVIMLTNFAYEQYRVKCEAAGADFFLDKSTEFDKISLALEQVRQSLRAVLPHTSDPLEQTSDSPIPAKASLTPGSGQNAGARLCPEHSKAIERNCKSGSGRAGASSPTTTWNGRRARPNNPSACSSGSRATPVSKPNTNSSTGQKRPRPARIGSHSCIAWPNA